jgi:hypothetical protein
VKPPDRARVVGAARKDIKRLSLNPKCTVKMVHRSQLSKLILIVLVVSAALSLASAARVRPHLGLDDKNVHPEY